jgi:hypothetical protein
MGFYELKDSGLPTVPWKQFDERTKLDENYLWTVRMAVYQGSDFNLPRIVGKKAGEACEAAAELYNKYKDNGVIVYYPYFIAEKSGTLQVSTSEIVIEAVDKDLWNLVTYNRKDVTIINNGKNLEIFGDEKFLKKTELNELDTYAEKVRLLFRNYIFAGKTLLLEWSYAYKTDVNSYPIGEKYLVFYEIKEI